MELITKKSYELFPIIFDQSNNFVILESVDSYTFTCINTTTGVDTSSDIIDSDTNGTNTVQLVIKDGTVGDKHKISMRVVGSSGGLYEKDLIVEIIDNYDGVFSKQSSEILSIKIEFKNCSSILDGDTLSTKTISATNVLYGTDVTSSIVSASAIQDDNSVIVICKDGLDNNNYKITGKVTTGLGYKYQIDVLMSVRDK